MHNKFKSLEYNEGFEAYCDGILRCPYEEGSMEWVDWHCGQFDARDYCEQE